MNIHKAFEFYQAYIYLPEKIKLLQEYNFSCAGSVSFVDWELFGAILTEEKKYTTGPDLLHYEIKSAKEKSSFEYQYHLYGGEDKFKYDATANHVFIIYNPSYANVEIRMANGSAFVQYFTEWKCQYKNDISSKVRFRRSLPYKTVVEKTQTVCRIINGQLNEN